MYVCMYVWMYGCIKSIDIRTTMVKLMGRYQSSSLASSIHLAIFPHQFIIDLVFDLRNKPAHSFVHRSLPFESGRQFPWPCRSLYVCMYVCMLVCMFVCVYGVYVCMYVCLYVYMNVERSVKNPPNSQSDEWYIDQSLSVSYHKWANQSKTLTSAKCWIEGISTGVSDTTHHHHSCR